MAGMSGESALRVIQRIADHVKKSFAGFNEIQPPQVQYEHRVAQINSILQECFERLREQRPEDASCIENEIIQFAGERKSLEMNGLQIAENAYKDQVTAVVQALSDRLVATLHQSFVQQSLQKLAAGTLEPNFLGYSEQATAQAGLNSANVSTCREAEQHPHLITQGDATDTELRINHLAISSSGQNGTLHDAGQADSRKREYSDLDGNQAEPNKKRVKSTTSIVPNRQHSDDEQGSSIIAHPGGISESITSSSEEGAHDDQDGTQGTVVLKIIDADGLPRGELEQAGLWGAKRVDSILKMPVKRPVQLRKGRPFTPEHLNAICENGVKIVSCMIQASGEVMEQPCAYCEKKNQGPSDQCIMVDDDLFRRCGNCEWVRGRCQGASTTCETLVASTTEDELKLGFMELRHGQINVPRPKDIPEIECRGGSHHTCDSTLGGDTVRIDTMAKPAPLAMVEGVGFAGDDTRWRIHQIKTGSFTSAESSIQLWCWFAGSKSLQYMLFSDMKWRCLQHPVDFDVKLEDVAKVRASAQSWRVRLVMKEHGNSGQQKKSREDVMVIFKERETVHYFLEFCHDQNIPVCEEEPPAMVTEWRNMGSLYTLISDE